MKVLIHAIVLLILASPIPALASSKTPATEKMAAAAPGSTPAKLATATFAGGCFWCVETAFEGKPGVKSVVSGYTSGFKLDPTYEEVSSGSTGHAESVQITYDPRAISYAKLLDIFWHNIDPTQGDGQFCDHGTQYRSGIYYADEAQKLLAEASKRAIAAKLQKPIVTAIVVATRFYPAEDYHQDFWKKSPVRYWSYRKGCGRDARLKQLWGKAPDTAH